LTSPFVAFQIFHFLIFPQWFALFFQLSALRHIFCTKCSFYFSMKWNEIQLGNNLFGNHTPRLLVQFSFICHCHRITTKCC
jgi:hypothetical protein